MKIKHFFALLLGMMVCLCGCRLNKPDVSCAVYSVPSSNDGTSYICANDTDQFMYQNVENEQAIYCNENLDEPFIKFDSGYDELVAMAASSDTLYLGGAHNYLKLYSLETRELLFEYEDVKVQSMKADSDDVFVVITRNPHAGSLYPELCMYEVLLFNGDDAYISLNETIASLEPIRKQDEFEYYEYDGYEIVVDSSIEKEIPQIAFISKQEFEYTCLPYNTYIKYNNEMYRIDMHDRMLSELDDSQQGGVYPIHVGVEDGVCTFIAQYAYKYYQANPSKGTYKDSYLCEYDLNTQKLKLLYKAKSNEAIVGFSKDKQHVYVLNSKGVYKKSLSTGKKERLLKIDIDETEWRVFTYCFVWNKDGYAVFIRDNTRRFEYVDTIE